ncbi:hypothetical protein GBAR_LOCUS26217 [Geodia barretti]|uniref:Uncharacterized protein n=1 Tax=Geodia barretti TaxID=519541 RepID=A0AA35TI91_GEOBA|nr:hypothetical protein GBAR_LOCUS26217 [Geodia barretti]
MLCSNDSLSGVLLTVSGSGLSVSGPGVWPLAAAAAASTGDVLSSSSGSRSSNLNTTSSETLSRMTCGSMNTTSGRMSRK